MAEIECNIAFGPHFHRSSREVSFKYDRNGYKNVSKEATKHPNCSAEMVHSFLIYLSLLLINEESNIIETIKKNKKQKCFTGDL